MAWDSSDRRSRLPGDWARRRLRVLRRDHYQCQARDAAGLRCLEPAREVDHIIAGDNHDLSNLQAICSVCHKRKTQREAQAARSAKGRRRPPSRHPGALA
jgi:5-methylcytosine-specific restriction protein A